MYNAMGATCIGCGKATGGVLGAYTVKLFYGEVCLTCKKKLAPIQGYQYLTPTQISDVIGGRVRACDVKPPNNFGGPGEAAPRQLSPAEEIRQYKELLDDGLITQEEFDAVKKRILNL